MLALIEEHAAHMRRRGLAHETIIKRCGRLRRMDAAIGLQGADADVIENYLDDLRGRDGGPLGAKARYQWVSDLHQFYRWAMDWGHLDEDPTVRLARPKQRQSLPRPIDTGDLILALQMAEPTMRTWLLLMAFGGLRCKEVAALGVDDLLWDSKLLRVQGKGDKERVVPMHADVERALRMMRRPSRGRVFRRPHGAGYPAAQVSREVAVYFQSLNIGATAHMLRHWYGTETYKACRDIRVVQELMGHSSPSTTAMYADWSKPEARRAVDALSLDIGTSLFTEWAS